MTLLWLINKGYFVPSLWAQLLKNGKAHKLQPNALFQQNQKSIFLSQLYRESQKTDFSS